MKKLSSYFESVFDVDKEIEKHPIGYEIPGSGKLVSVKKGIMKITGDIKKGFYLNEDNCEEYYDIAREYDCEEIDIDYPYSIMFNPSKDANFHDLIIKDISNRVYTDNKIVFAPNKPSTISNLHLTENDSRHSLTAKRVDFSYGSNKLTLNDCTIDLPASNFSSKFIPTFKGKTVINSETVKLNLFYMEEWNAFNEMNLTRFGSASTERISSILNLAHLDLKFFPRLDFLSVVLGSTKGRTTQQTFSKNGNAWRIGGGRF